MYRSLVEAKLSDSGRVRLLERSEIDQVLEEIEFSLLWEAGNVAERLKLGSLLRADLLVLLHLGQQKDGSQRIDVAVCDTRSGLRLRLEALRVDEDLSKTLDTVEAILDQALQKHGSRFTYVFSVPPMICKDFEHTYADLSGIYRRVVEQALIAEPHAVAVELEEANAILTEDRLTGGRGASSRPLPYFVKGEYENVRTDTGEIQVVLRFSLHHGDGEAMSSEQRAVPQEQAIESIRSITRRLTQKLTSNRNAPIAPDIESQELLRFARLFMRSDNLSEALYLIEASLLIQPEDPELNHYAMNIATKLAMKLLSDTKGHLAANDQGGKVQSRAAIAQSALRTASAATERWIGCADLGGRRVAVWGVQRVCHEWTGVLDSEEQYSEQRHQFEQLIHDHKARVYQALEKRILAEPDRFTPHHLSRFENHIGYPPQDRKEDLRLIEVTQYAMGCSYWYVGLLSGFPVSKPRKGETVPYIEMTAERVGTLKDPDFLDRVNRVAKLKSESAQEAVGILRYYMVHGERIWNERRDMLAENAKRFVVRDKQKVWVHYREGAGVRRQPVKRGEAPEPQIPPIDRADPVETEIDFVEISLTLATDEAHDEIPEPPWTIVGWLACDDDIDVVYSPNELYVMKRKGDLQSLYRSSEPEFHDMHRHRRSILFGDIAREVVCSYDGKYLWAPARYADDPHLVVADPRSGIVRHVTQADGLPPMNVGLCVTGVGPGRAIVAAAFGKPGAPEKDWDRGWCGLVTVGDDGKVTVDILLKSNSRLVLGDAPDELTNPQNAFRPAALYTLRNPDDPSDVRVIMLRIVRDQEEVKLGAPLLIYPDSHKAEPAPFQMGPGVPPHLSFVHKGRLYVADDEHRLTRVGYPEFTIERLDFRIGRRVVEGNSLVHIYSWNGAPAYVVAMIENRLHVIADKAWWVGPEWGRPRHPLIGKLPKDVFTYTGICRSNHYGVVMLAGSGMEPIRPFQVKISPEALQRVDNEPPDARPAPDTPYAPGASR